MAVSVRTSAAWAGTARAGSRCRRPPGPFHVADRAEHARDSVEHSICSGHVVDDRDPTSAGGLHSGNRFGSSCEAHPRASWGSAWWRGVIPMDAGSRQRTGPRRVPPRAVAGPGAGGGWRARGPTRSAVEWFTTGGSGAPSRWARPRVTVPGDEGSGGRSSRQRETRRTGRRPRSRGDEPLDRRVAGARLEREEERRAATVVRPGEVRPWSRRAAVSAAERLVELPAREVVGIRDAGLGREVLRPLDARERVGTGLVGSPRRTWRAHVARLGCERSSRHAAGGTRSGRWGARQGSRAARSGTPDQSPL